ncbi:MAG TPA: hypothetical protein VIF12_03955 [Micavibrio sp.]
MRMEFRCQSENAEEYPAVTWVIYNETAGVAAFVARDGKDLGELQKMFNRAGLGDGADLYLSGWSKYHTGQHEQALVAAKNLGPAIDVALERMGNNEAFSEEKRFLDQVRKMIIG